MRAAKERTSHMDLIRKALDLGDLARLERLAIEAPEHEILEGFSSLPGEHQYVLLTVLPPQKAAAILANLDPEDQLEFLETLPSFQVRGILEALDPDDLTDILQRAREADPERFEHLIQQLDPETRNQVRRLLAYEEDEAGG